MFTGIVQGLGTVRVSKVLGLDLKLVVDAGGVNDGVIRIGDSVAVDGVCLTVVGVIDDDIRFDVSRESLDRTLLGSKLSGDRVNLELAALPTTRLGGHYVTGHVDGIGYLEDLRRIGSSNKMRIGLPGELSHYVAVKGSICVDGVSLTVNSVDDHGFEVNIVPHTHHATTMNEYAVGRRVHLEIDIIARYLERLMVKQQPQGIYMQDTAAVEETLAGENMDQFEEITGEFLSKQGFIAPDLGE